MPAPATTDLSTWQHLMPHLPVSDIGKSTAYYEESLGFRLAWQTTDQKLTALASGAIELLLLVPWTGNGPIPAQSFYIYVEDPDALYAEYELAGATMIDPVASRSYGMRDFVVADPDGHRFTLGRGEENLRDVASYYSLTPDEMISNPDWLERRR